MKILAREILELHTLGVDGGYSQDDIVALAKVLTGWTVDLGERVPSGKVASASTRTDMSQGPSAYLARSIVRMAPDRSERSFENSPPILRLPATLRNGWPIIASVSVALPPCARRSRRLISASGGDLKAVTQALVRHDEAWTTPLQKSRSPFDLICAVGRLLGQAPEPPQVERSLKAMGQPFWRCPSPAGWSEADDAWGGARCAQDTARLGAGDRRAPFGRA